jgi:hypothetical protein
MLEVTFKVYEASVNKTFVNVKEVRNIEDFRLYAFSLWGGNWEIVSVN